MEGLSAETERKSALIFVNVWTIRVLEGCQRVGFHWWGSSGGVSSAGIDPSGGVVFVGEFDIYCKLSAFACGDSPRIL